MNGVGEILSKQKRYKTRREEGVARGIHATKPHVASIIQGQFWFKTKAVQYVFTMTI